MNRGHCVWGIRPRIRFYFPEPKYEHAFDDVKVRISRQCDLHSMDNQTGSDSD